MWDTYGDKVGDTWKEIVGFNMLIIASLDDDLEEEMIAFARENPEASLQELLQYNISISPPLEMADDDEEDEDWDDDYDGGPDESWDKELFKRGDRRK